MRSKSVINESKICGHCCKCDDPKPSFGSGVLAFKFIWIRIRCQCLDPGSGSKAKRCAERTLKNYILGGKMKHFHGRWVGYGSGQCQTGSETHTHSMCDGLCRILGFSPNLNRLLKNSQMTSKFPSLNYKYFGAFSLKVFPAIK